MFNIVKRCDFMLADDLPTSEAAERLRLEKYGHDYIVVSRTIFDHKHEPVPSDAPLTLPGK